MFFGCCGVGIGCVPSLAGCIRGKVGKHSPALDHFLSPNKNHHTANMATTRHMITTEAHGTTGGTYFDDRLLIGDLENAVLVKILLYHGAYLNSLTVSCPRLLLLSLAECLLLI